MILDWLSQAPSWALQLLWSAVSLLLIVLMGQLLARVLCRRLARWAAQTSWQWDDALVEALQRGIPLWALLYGLYVATGFWQLSPHAVDVIGRVLQVAGWLSVTVIGAGMARRLTLAYGQRFAAQMPMTSLTQHIAQIAVVVLGTLMILNAMGVSITPILTALGVGGLAVALALQDTLSNLFAGFYLTISRHVAVGNYIKLDTGQEGYIHDIGWRATQIRMLPNNMVIVPNNKLSQAIITNFDLPSHDLAVAVEVGVDYASDLAKVERVTSEVGRDVMRTVAGGVPEFEPFLRYHTFGEFSIQFTAILRAKTFVDQYLIKHEFIKRLQVRYRQEGIIIPFPIQTVHRLDDG